MQKQNELTHEIVLNVGGQAVVAVRVNEEIAKSIAKSFGAHKDFDSLTSFTHWPLSIRRVGAKTLAESNALAHACAPKLQVQEGEIVAIFTGKLKKGYSDTDGLNVKNAKQFLQGLTSKLPETCEWNVAIVDPGTIIEGS